MAGSFRLFFGRLVGVPLAYLADRRLRPGGGREVPLWAGSVGATVAAVAVLAAGTGLLLGRLGLGACSPKAGWRRRSVISPAHLGAAVRYPR